MAFPDVRTRNVDTSHRLIDTRYQHSALKLRRSVYLAPVVLLLGFGEQFRFCGFASFSQAAKLAYLQFKPPLADILIQNGEFPVVCDFCMLLDEGDPIVP